MCFSSKHPESLAKANNEKLLEFMDNRVSLMFKMRDSLMQNSKPKELSNRLFKKFQSLKPGYLKEFGEERYIGKAAKNILKEFDKSQIFKHKMVKTLGGFIALGLMIKPIDHFVEHVLIAKTIEPNLEKFNMK